MRTATSPWRSTAPRRRGATSRTGPERSGKPRPVGLDHGRQLGQLLADALRGRAAASLAGGDRALDGQDATHRRREGRRDLGELLVGELVELDAELLAPADAGTGDLVGDPEGDAL